MKSSSALSRIHVSKRHIEAHRFAPHHVMCSELIAVALLLALALSSLDPRFLVVLLQSRQVLACLRELAFLHALPDIPMHKRTLGVHQVKLVVDAGEDLSDGCGVTDHADSTHDLGQVAAGYHSRRLIIDAALEPCWAPIHKLDGAFGLDRCNRCVHILGYDV